MKRHRQSWKRFFNQSGGKPHPGRNVLSGRLLAFLLLCGLACAPHALSGQIQHMITDMNATPNSDYGGDPKRLVHMNGFVLFVAETHLGQELWRSDGTASGTKLVKDVWPGTESGNVENLTLVNGIVYFRGGDSEYGNELWRTDGTVGGTTMVKNIGSGSTGSNISELYDANGVLVFTANDGTNGQELWKSDGTEAGTNMVIDLAGATGDIEDVVGFNGFMFSMIPPNSNYIFCHT